MNQEKILRKLNGMLSWCEGYFGVKRPSIMEYLEHLIKELEEDRDTSGGKKIQFDHDELKDFLERISGGKFTLEKDMIIHFKELESGGVKKEPILFGEVTSNIVSEKIRIEEWECDECGNNYPWETIDITRECPNCEHKSFMVNILDEQEGKTRNPPDHEDRMIDSFWSPEKKDNEEAEN